ncbi:hypothetical protein ACFL47_02380 [Candidatus Latescibacterota bacterium]
MKRALTVFFMTALITIGAVDAQVKVDPDYLKAQELEAKGKYDEARVLYERLYKTSGSDQFYWRLLLLYDRMDDFVGMEALALKRLIAHPNDLSTLRYLSEAYYGQGKREIARQTILNMIGEAWTDMSRVRLAAGELINHNDYDLALNILTKARELNQSDVAFSGELARIYFIRFEFDRAIEEYLKTLDSTDITYANIKTALDRSIVENYDPQRLEKPLQSYIEQNPASIKGARLLSGFRYKLGDYRGAYDALIKTAVATYSSGEIWSLAERLNRENHGDEAILVYDGFYHHFPKDTKRVKALMTSAQLSAEKGDIDAARRKYQTVADESQGKPEGALATLRMLKLSADSMTHEGYFNNLSEFAGTTEHRGAAYEAYLLLAGVCMKTGRRDEAFKALNNARVKARSKHDIFTIFSVSAKYRFWSGDFDAMLQEIDACVTILPGQGGINDLLGMKLLAMRSSTPADRIALSAYAAGEYALFRESIGEAVDSLSVAAADTSTVVSSTASKALAEFYRGRHDMKTSYSWYISAASAAADTTERVRSIIDAADILHVELGDDNGARTLYLDALTSYPGTVYDSVVRRKLRSLPQ